MARSGRNRGQTSLLRPQWANRARVSREGGEDGCEGDRAAGRGAGRGDAAPQVARHPCGGHPAASFLGGVPISVLMEFVCAAAGRVFPEDLAFLPPARRTVGEERGRAEPSTVAGRLAGRRGQDGRRERSAPRAPMGAHGEGRRAPEAVRSEGWSEGAIVPQGEEGACRAWPLAVGGRRPASLGCGASVSRPRAALGLADSSAERRRPGPTSHSGLSRSLSCAWVAPLRGGGRGGAEPPSAPPTAETGLSPFQLRA